MINKIENYTHDIINDFVEAYTKRLDNNIYQMLNAFGFKGGENEISEWLNTHNMDILMDENKINDESVKVIYLVKNNSIMAWFGVKIFGEENLSYSFTDVYVKDGD